MLEAVDLGAGDKRHEIPGFHLITTDIRPEVNPDVVADTRRLPFADDSFDLTASSHHLEHFHGFDQMRVWREIFRITKPGGITEHVFPNLEWAAEQVVRGNANSEVLGVIFGAQGGNGYAPELDTHYMGYTPWWVRHLAGRAGFVDIIVESYKDVPSLRNHIRMKATKPQKVE